MPPGGLSSAERRGNGGTGHWAVTAGPRLTLGPWKGGWFQEDAQCGSARPPRPNRSVKQRKCRQNMVAKTYGAARAPGKKLRVKFICIVRKIDPSTLLNVITQPWGPCCSSSMKGSNLSRWRPKPPPAHPQPTPTQACTFLETSTCFHPLPFNFFKQ